MSRLWSFRVQLPDRARVTVLLAAETNERALCVFISRKSRYFVLIDPIKAELEGRRELTAECTTTDQEKKMKLDRIKPPILHRETFRNMREQRWF
jgi:hypothetical protein